MHARTHTYIGFALMRERARMHALIPLERESRRAASPWREGERERERENVCVRVRAIQHECERKTKKPCVLAEAGSAGTTSQKYKSRPQAAAIRLSCGWKATDVTRSGPRTARCRHYG